MATELTGTSPVQLPEPLFWDYTRDEETDHVLGSICHPSRKLPLAVQLSLNAWIYIVDDNGGCTLEIDFGQAWEYVTRDRLYPWPTETDWAKLDLRLDACRAKWPNLRFSVNRDASISYFGAYAHDLEGRYVEIGTGTTLEETAQDIYDRILKRSQLYSSTPLESQ